MGMDRLEDTEHAFKMVSTVRCSEAQVGCAIIEIKLSAMQGQYQGQRSYDEVSIVHK